MRLDSSLFIARPMLIGVHYCSLMVPDDEIHGTACDDEGRVVPHAAYCTTVCTGKPRFGERADLSARATALPRAGPIVLELPGSTGRTHRDPPLDTCTCMSFVT